MKPFTILAFSTLIILAACSPAVSDDAQPADSGKSTLDEEDTTKPKAADRPSQDRPFDLACNDPDYRSGQPDTYIALHSPLYPFVQDKSERLLADIKALAPKVTDEDVYDLEADLLARRKLNALNQLVFVMGQDLAPHYLLNFCDVASYQDDECRLIRRMMKNQLELYDFARDGDALSYKARYTDGTLASVYVANRDWDGVRLDIQSAATGAYRGEWARAEDGTETFSSVSADATFSYTENPDCSGSARAIRKDDGGHDWRLSWTWTSASSDAPVIVQFSECKTNGLDEEECVSGTL